MILPGFGLNQRARWARHSSCVGALATLLGLQWVAAPTPAAAQTEESSQNAAAEALFRDGVTLAKAGKFTEAAAKFEASFALDPARGTLLGWAMAEERAGKLGSAWGHYQELRDLARAEGDQERATVAVSKIQELTPRVPTVTVTAAGKLPDGTKVTLDGRPLRRGGLGSALPVDPGDHELRAVAPDGSSFDRQLSLAEGARENVVIELAGRSHRAAPAPAEPRPAAESSTWTDWQTSGVVIGAAGLVAMGVGGYFWFNSGRIYEEVDSACLDRVCPPEQQSRIDDGRRQESIGRVALIAGGAATAVGAALVVVGGDAHGGEPRDVALQIGPGSLALAGTF